jgi:hypothetical protein
MKAYKLYTANELSNADYHGGEGISSSKLKDALEDIELYYKKYITKEIPREHFTAFDVGTYFHTAILEPHKLQEDVAVYPGLVRRGKEYDTFCEVNQGKAIILGRDVEQLQPCIDAVNNSPIATKILKSGKPEVSGMIEVFIQNGAIYLDGGEKLLGVNGWQACDKVNLTNAFILKIKVRADCISISEKTILDLKSTTGSLNNINDLAKKVGNYYYDLSAALYVDVFSVLCGFEKFNFVWTWGSKDIGTCKNTRASFETLQVGRAKYKAALLNIAHYAQRGWKFPDTMEVIDLPIWDKKQWLLENDLGV